MMSSKCYPIKVTCRILEKKDPVLVEKRSFWVGVIKKINSNYFGLGVWVGFWVLDFLFSDWSILNFLILLFYSHLKLFFFLSGG